MSEESDTHSSAPSLSANTSVPTSTLFCGESKEGADCKEVLLILSLVTVMSSTGGESLEESSRLAADPVDPTHTTNTVLLYSRVCLLSPSNQVHETTESTNHVQPMHKPCMPGVVQ